MNERNQEIIRDILNPNPLRRGFIFDAQDDILRFLKGESNEVRQLSCRLAHKIIELFDLDDCEVFAMGETDGEYSWALVRILPQNDGTVESQP